MQLEQKGVLVYLVNVGFKSAEQTKGEGEEEEEFQQLYLEEIIQVCANLVGCSAERMG